ncbi:hypothetical protein [Streptomyces sp. TRM49041]|uniref:hypothetical protein n=1 Tax=Streptomyces sp. TRM49041 TaxID=2603216 RepID=UPI0021CD0B58|nr:hypothetical protein [Streptomyces sp. TRM49041]
MRVPEARRRPADGAGASPESVAGRGTGRGRQGRRPRGRGAALAGVVAVLAAVTVGCGIRTTSVPVDAGGAPSRVPCSLSDTEAPDEPADGVPVRVYLVCASALEAVDRTVLLPDGVSGDASRVATAQALADAARERPSQIERQAGFTTYLQRPLTVSAGRAGDPPGALRLSRQPEDLPPEALAQLVCTYAESDTTSVRGTVVLGGPGDYPVRRYVCDRSVKERPESPVPTRAP